VPCGVSAVQAPASAADDPAPSVQMTT
jgi:hypothetical protein